MTTYGAEVVGGVFDAPPGVGSGGLVAVGVGESCELEGWPTEVMSIGVGGRVAFDGIVCWIFGTPSWMLGKRPIPPQSITTPAWCSAKKPAAPPHETMLKMMPTRIIHFNKRRSRSWRPSGETLGEVLLGSGSSARISRWNIGHEHESCSR